MDARDTQVDNTEQPNLITRGWKNQLVILSVLALAIGLAALIIRPLANLAEEPTQHLLYKQIQSSCIPSTIVRGTYVGEGDGYRGIAVVSSQDVWVVGNTHASIGPIELSQEQALIQHWDGVNWNTSNTINILQDRSFYLRSVAATSGNDVWAVGQSYTSSPYTSQALIIHWDGKQWHTMQNASLSLSGSSLNAVATNKQGGVWAIGSYLNSKSKSQPLIMHWDGAKWNTSNLSLDIEGELFGIALLSPNDIWVVGYYMQEGKSQPLLLHWDGVSWQIKITPRLGNDVILHSIAPVSGSNVWVAGSSKSGGVIFNWDGTSWVDTPSSVSMAPGSSINGLVALDDENVWAIGSNQKTTAPIVLHWDGRGWVDVSSPYLKFGQAFFDIAKDSKGDVWAAGHSFSDKDGQYGLIAHFTGTPCPAVTSTPTSKP